MTCYETDTLGVGVSIWVSGFGMVISTVLCAKLVFAHYKNLNYPSAQKLLFVVLTAPVLLGWPSWTVLVAGEKAVFLELLADMAKAVLSYFFTLYAICLLGKELNGDSYKFNPANLETSLLGLGSVKHLLKCFGEIKLDSSEAVASFLKRVKICVVQYLVVLVLVFIGGVVYIIADGSSSVGDLEESGYAGITAVKLLSTLVALYHFFTFSGALKQVPHLDQLNIATKFTSIKLCFMATQFQPLVLWVFAALGLIADTQVCSVSETTVFASNLLMCSEMLALAFVQVFLYPPLEYKPNTERSPQPVKDTLNIETTKL